jgi:hypothetical protein
MSILIVNYKVSHTDTDNTLIDIYGVLMFFSAMALTVYLCLALTVMYPLLESIPDFAAMEAYRNLAERWGGYENFLFNFGMRVARCVLYAHLRSLSCGSVVSSQGAKLSL